MRGSQILIQGEPQGTWDEGTITDTSKPGTVMEEVPGTAYANGRPSWRARALTAGAKGVVAVLLPDTLQGKTATDAYVSGTRCFLYFPIAGENLNMLVGDVTGTGDTIAIGAKFGINNDGKLKADSTYTSAPFEAQETLTALTADTLVWMKYLGSHA
jgi:hypothetical protein